MMVDVIDPAPLPVRLVVENRTGELVTLDFYVHPTGERGALVIPPRGTGRFPPCDPRKLAWTNEAEITHAKLPIEAADTLDAAREPGAPLWEGLAFRQESAVTVDPAPARVAQ